MAKTNVKKLYRSEENKMLLGVCGGIGEYTGVDPSVVRIIWTILTVVTGVMPGIVAYLLCAIIIPKK